MYQITTATRKILSLEKRIRAVAGGTSASKTFSILMWLIDYAHATKNQLISVVSETMPHLRKGAMRDFLNILEIHGYYNDECWNRTDCIYKFPTGSKIEFFSADQPGKVRGPRRDVLFLNEANNVSFETYTQLEIRTRSVVWLDWNPVQEFWFYTDLQHHENVDFITLTYLDNEALDPGIVQTIEAKKGNKNWWKVYGLGQLGEVEGRIYVDWQEIDEVPHEARLERYGLDFGYTNDPTAIVAIYRYNNGFILKEICYQKGLSNKRIADIFHNNPKALVIADSAEPKSIDEIMSYGVMIQPCTKGPGSVLQKIQFVQDQRISYTKNSLNLKKEYRNYIWEKSREDQSINVPPETMDHCMRAVEYGLSAYDYSVPNQKELEKLNALSKGKRRRFGR